MGGPFKALGSIFAAAGLCLVAVAAARADDGQSGEIIETDFLSAPLTDESLNAQTSASSLPDAEASLQVVPVEVIGGLPPAEPLRRQERSGGRDVAGSSSPSGGSEASGGDASGDGGSGDGGAGGGSGDGGSGGGGKGRGDKGGGKGRNK